MEQALRNIAEGDRWEMPALFRVKYSLDQLSELERTCFVLKHLEHWRLDDIAESLQTGVNNIKQALFRALRKLRVSMAPWRNES